MSITPTQRKKLRALVESGALGADLVASLIAASTLIGVVPGVPFLGVEESEEDEEGIEWPEGREAPLEPLPEYPAGVFPTGTEKGEITYTIRPLSSSASSLGADPSQTIGGVIFVYTRAARTTVAQAFRNLGWNTNPDRINTGRWYRYESSAAVDGNTPRYMTYATQTQWDAISAEITRLITLEGYSGQLEMYMERG